MRMIGYGEDALTLRSVTERLPELLSQLGDQSDPDSALVLFRPSFGRRSGSREGGRGASFGEFDAVVATGAGVYLIEAKWSRSSETHHKETVVLRDEQIRRHEVMKWYLRRWRELRPTSWELFRTDVKEEFEAAFPTLTVPRHDQHLGENVEYVLQLLADCGEKVVDVLLYADADGLQCPPLPEGSQFRAISIIFDDVHRTGFFPLSF